MAKLMTIGRLAAQADISIETIRFYESQELLIPDERTDAGYRLYHRNAVERITFIKSAQNLGFALREIKDLLFLRTDDHATRADVRRHIEEKMAVVRRKIEALERIQESLETLLGSCEGQGSASTCPILEAFANSVDPEHVET
ncbi:Heavy metal-responsive transcriptional regulator [Sulfidibacter corallicola]|uniref:Heavy metal-responsive transcriptional regulator n=1 Tax=Sulfidibacter corallicola TaxID=2818388 RepID=A0A8A4TI55_SULCO|nr:heavy metal-responsive transcriptional regulator [Sulfidibacter corallicola]QTD49606.1 heavy metal-responsive transcriptional regulator [Sulfidibacter corallicola]